MSYQLKKIPQDFIVKEVSLEPDLLAYEKSQYTYLLLKKIGFSTFDAIENVANYFNLSDDNISSQGLKDEDGVTYQTISIKKLLLSEDLLNFNKLCNETNNLIQLENIIGYGEKEVKAALLHGNVFSLTIRNLEPAVINDFNNYFKKKKLISFVNYYDSQRFGIIGNIMNSYLIGENLVKHNWRKAYDQFIISGDKRPKIDNLSLFGNKNKIINFFHNLNTSRINFFVSSYNSWLWNKATSEYLKTNKKSKVCNFSSLGDLYLTGDTDQELKNIMSSPGYKINTKDFSINQKTCSRNIVTSTKIFLLYGGQDELNQGKEKIKISFFLPAGSYATMLVRQLFWQLNDNKS